MKCDCHQSIWAAGKGLSASPLEPLERQQLESCIQEMMFSLEAQLWAVWNNAVSYVDYTCFLICHPLETLATKRRLLEMFPVGEGGQISLYWHFCPNEVCWWQPRREFSSNCLWRELQRGQVIAFLQVLQSWSRSPVAFYPHFALSCLILNEAPVEHKLSCWLTCWSAWATWTVAPVIFGMSAKCGPAIGLGEAVMKIIKQWMNKN